MSIEFRKIVIIGVGLIGGSIAKACRKALPQTCIIGIDEVSASLETGVESGVLNEGHLPSDPAVDELLSQHGCDLVIVATPVTAARGWFQRIERDGYEGVLTDVASTKGIITMEAAEILTFPQLYIPGHPMAGSEMSGIEASSATLFQGAYWVLCPDAATVPEAYQALHGFVVTLGARVITLDRNAHDSAIAIVSHVPHVVASSLVQLAGDHATQQPNLLRLAAGGFKDSTRIAAGSPELWTGIIFENREAITRGLRELSGIITSFADHIHEGDEKGVQDMLAKPAEIRRGLPAKWVPDSSRLVECRIPMRNRRGVIAEVTAIASDAGCNIQSIDIDHMTDESAVLDLIFTDEGDIGKLSYKLLEAGYDFSFSPLAIED